MARILCLLLDNNHALPSASAFTCEASKRAGSPTRGLEWSVIDGIICSWP